MDFEVMKIKRKDRDGVNLSWSDVVAMVIAMMQVILPALIGMVIFVVLIGLVFSLFFR